MMRKALFFLFTQRLLVFAFVASDFLVKDLEKAEPAYSEFDGEMYAGLLPIDIVEESSSNGDDTVRGELMFWLFRPDNLTAPDTLTIWLNGGPGCSSFFAGNLFECSPVTTKHYPAGYPSTSYDQPFSYNKWAWTNATNMMYVEQPTNVGWSWGPTPETEADLSRDFYNFLINFYRTFPEMAPKRLFIFGESYAGMYVPSIAHKIHLENKQSVDEKINLNGIGIGNGWMDASVQGPVVIDYAYWHGMIDSSTRGTLYDMWEDCKQGKDKLTPPLHPFTIPDECNIMGATLEAAGGGIFEDKSPNVYDVTTWDKYPLLTSPNSNIIKFFNKPEVKKALNAPMDKDWVGCMPGAGRRLEDEEELLPGKLLLAHDKPESVVPYVAELLDEADIRVLIYNGDRDISVCAQGSELLLDNMNWNGADGWKNNATRGLWMVDDKVAGYAKSYSRLDFVIVYNSGHLVPNNVPVPALDLITRFVSDQHYLDVELRKFANERKEAKPLISQNQSTFWQFFTLAMISFCSGVLVATCWAGRKRNGYSSISDT